MRAAGSKGVTCMVCLRIKQKCGAVWGEEKAGRSAAGSGAGLSVGSSGFPCLGEGIMKLLEQLVVGVERIGSELARVNKQLEGLEKVIGEYVDNKADDIADEGMA